MFLWVFTSVLEESVVSIVRVEVNQNGGSESLYRLARGFERQVTERRCTWLTSEEGPGRDCRLREASNSK
jgi:hypothetical protein